MVLLRDIIFRGHDDTVYDMIYNVIGSFISCLVAYMFFPFEDVKSSLSSRSHS